MKKNTTSQPVNAFTVLPIDRLSFFCFLTIFLLSTVIFFVNHYYWHYAPVSYFLNSMPIIFLGLLLVLAGSFFFFGIHSKLTQIFVYIMLYNLIVNLVMYATTAIQLTPFTPIDQHLLRADLALHYDTVKILAKLSLHPWILKLLYYAYNFIDLELLLLPIFLIIFQKFYHVKCYFFFVLLTTLLGFFLYYFWPTTAPASVLNSAYFLPEQHNTGIKFYQVHHQIFPESVAGGLIAMPSFHVIWAILCQQSVWQIRWLWYGLLPLNILVVFAALLLGWHYFVDFLGSVFLIIVGWFILLLS